MIAKRVFGTLIALCFPAVIMAGEPAPTSDKGKPGVHLHEGLVYRTLGSRQLKLDVACPAKEDSARPAILFVHGTGPLSKGRKHLTEQIREAARLGFVGVSPSYRNAPAEQFPAPVEDVRAALDWLHENAAKFGVDVKRIAVVGFSGGGSIACYLGLEKEMKCCVKAVVAVSAPTDFARLYEHYSEMQRKEVSFLQALRLQYLRNAVEAFLGGPPEAMTERYAQASPCTHVRKDGPPILLMHGTDDRVVPVEQAQRFARKLSAAGGRVSLLEFFQAGHDFEELEEYQALVNQATFTFLNMHLRAGDRK